MNQATLDKLKVATNLLLALLLFSVLVLTLLYKQDIQEAIGLKEPNRLMQIYEEKTNTKCLCANPQFGNVIYLPNS